MATIEEQLLAERERMWKRFSFAGFVGAFLTLIFLGIMLLAAVN